MVRSRVALIDAPRHPDQQALLMRDRSGDPNQLCYDPAVRSFSSSDAAGVILWAAVANQNPNYRKHKTAAPSAMRRLRRGWD